MSQLIPSILIIYTGGTIGMKHNPELGVMQPLNFDQIVDELPELKKLGYSINTISFSPPIDSSDMDPTAWGRLARIIGENYSSYDGFVILHGTDTMAYTASALSFMLDGLSKPVILTGSQLPIGMIRTDGKENLISSIEIAAARGSKGPMVPEVCVFFENKLFRGNRSTKHNTENFTAFRSNNYPPLAEAGVKIRYCNECIRYPKPNSELVIRNHFNSNVIAIKLFPGISTDIFEAQLAIAGLKGVVLETFGSGNSPSYPWLLDSLEKTIKRGVIVFNVTQCPAGSVAMGKYSHGHQLEALGVVSGGDITFEAAIVKLMLLLGHHNNSDDLISRLKESIAGEITSIDQ